MSPRSGAAMRPEIFERIAGLLRILVLGLAVTFCYFASSLCITLLVAAFLAIVADPLVSLLERWRIPRWLSAGALVLGGMAGIGFLASDSFNRVSEFTERLPVYAERIRDMAEPLNRKIVKVEESAGKLGQEEHSKKITEVKVAESKGWPAYVVRGFGSVSSAVLVLSMVPFLTFFLLAGKEKWHGTIGELLRPRVDPEEFAARVASIVRRFVLGNLVVGALLAGATVGLLSALHVDGAVMLGVVSGALNLIPFLGALLAAGVPMAAALAQSAPVGTLVLIGLGTLVLHVISANLIIPRLVGSRINIGPAVATAGILFWGWLWGFMGVLLAIPLTGIVKLVADAHPPLRHLSNILGTSVRRAEKPEIREGEVAARSVSAAVYE